MSRLQLILMHFLMLAIACYAMRAKPGGKLQLSDHMKESLNFEQIPSPKKLNQSSPSTALGEQAIALVYNTEFLYDAFVPLKINVENLIEETPADCTECFRRLRIAEAALALAEAKIVRLEALIKFLWIIIVVLVALLIYQSIRSIARRQCCC